MKTTLFKSKNFKVISEPLLSSSGGQLNPTEYIWQPDVVIALPVHDDGHITLVQHSRPILATTLLECPGGKVDQGETLENAIIRELQEEVGFTPTKLNYVDYFYSSVGTSTEKIHFFVAMGLVPHKRKPADTKRMKIVDMGLDDIEHLLTQGNLHDGKTIIALYYYTRATRRKTKNKSSK